MIDRPPAQGPAPSEIPQPPSEIPQPPSEIPQPRRGPHIGPLKITPAVVLVAIAMIGSVGYIVYVVTQVQDEQIPLLGAGFGVLGASFAVIAIGTLVGMWRAASRTRTGRAFGLAIVGGIAGLVAIACFTFTAVALLLDRS